jgi:hypothetical protein
MLYVWYYSTLDDPEEWGYQVAPRIYVTSLLVNECVWIIPRPCMWLHIED